MKQSSIVNVVGHFGSGIAFRNDRHMFNIQLLYELYSITTTMLSIT